MKTTRFVKTLAMLLAVMLVAGVFAGCSGTPSQSPSAAPSATADASPTEDASPTVAPSATPGAVELPSCAAIMDYVYQQLKTQYGDELAAVNTLPDFMVAEYLPSVTSKNAKDVCFYLEQQVYDVFTFVLIEMNDPADWDAYKTDIEKYITDYRRQYENYTFPQEAIVDKAVYAQEGNYAYFLMVEQVEDAQATLLKALRGEVTVPELPAQDDEDLADDEL